MYLESDYIMLSALQHYQFCPRQCALIHIEQQWAENRFTAEGKVLHECVDSNKSEWVGDVRVVRTLPICSQCFGLSGQADVVEFHADGTVYPVEYKRGKPKKNHCDEVQLCAQALCLEEMLNVQVDSGALFYGQRKRRKEIQFDAALRILTQDIISETHQLIQSGKTPPEEYDKKCDTCSLLQICMPKSCGAARSVSRYMNRMLGGD
ncbi:MAG: CRISPR-associated protein Cas4 [Desulfuromusa sp.]|nr:CRISPR-associated protein Cas4 [Desulfuromusa sp.]